MQPSKLLLMHLSDIHFRYRPSFDLDADLRNEMELDAASLAQELGAAHGVLVTGDVAFAGRTDEYDTATEWLTKFCDRIGCPAERVWVIPGNHDVDRRIAENSVFLRDAQDLLRRVEPARVDERLREYLSDASAGPLFLQPLANYNHFAAQFGCASSHAQLHWEQDLPLNRGFTLRIRGVNSTLVSNSRDDGATNKLVVGVYQATVTREPGIAHMLLCHHPPDWLMDYEAVEDVLNSRVQVQLFGHKHRQRMQQVGGSLRVFAGAVHPSRREPGWEPRYNLLTLAVEGNADLPELLVEVWPRIWNEEHTRFLPEYDALGRPHRTYRMPLESIRPARMSAVRSTDTSTAEHPTHAPTTMAPEATDMGPKRRLMYRFFSLPFHKRVGVAVELGLLRDEDEGLEDNRLFERVLSRAQESGRLAALWEQVEAQHGDVQHGPNPFE